MTGSGFPQLASNTGVTLYFKTDSKTVSTSGATSVSLYGQSIWSSSAGSGTVAADATGAFQALFDVPTLPADTYNVFATYTPAAGTQQLTSAVQFTIVPHVSVLLANDLGTAAVIPTSTTVHFDQYVRIRVYSFGPSDSVTISGLPVLSGTSVTVSTDANGDYSPQVFQKLTGNSVGGVKTITASGTTCASGSCSASTTITLAPELVLYDSQYGGSTLSIPASAPNTVYVEGHGFGNAETINSNSILVGGQTTSSSSVTTTSSGTFGVNPGAHLAVTYTSALSFGKTTITVTGSKTGTVTFGYGQGYVLNPSMGTIDLRNTPIIAANAGSGSYVVLAALSSNSAPFGSRVSFYVEGATNNAALSSITIDSNATHVTTHVAQTPATTANGGVIVGYFDIPKMAQVGTGTSFDQHTVTISLNAGNNPGTLTLTTPPLLTFYTYDTSDSAAGQVTFPNSASTSNYGYLAVRGNGFKSSENLNLNVAGVLFTNFVTSLNSTGGFALTAVTTGSLNNIAAGDYTITLSGSTSTNNATGYDFNTLSGTENQDISTTLNVIPNFGKALSSALSVTSVKAGDTVVLQSTTSAGIHGLAPSTQYQVYLDGPSGTLLTTFTSTTSGQVPAGTQIVIPAAVTGTHIIDIVQNGASVVFGKTLNGQEDLAIDESTYSALSITISGSITVTPSAGGVGSNVSVSGSGLAASTGYTVQVGSISYATFTTTASGAIPSGVSFAFPQIAATGSELGTSETVKLVNSVTNAQDASGTFLLQGTMTLSNTTAAAGSSVTATAKGLKASQGYNIIWNAAVNSNGLTTGTIVGGFVTGTDGSVSTSFTVPATAAVGSYSVSLLQTNQTLGGSSVSFRLATPPTLNVGAAGSQGCNTTSCLSGLSASQYTQLSYPAVQVSFTNTANQAQTVLAYAVVHNSAGQTVYIGTGTAVIAAGASGVAYPVLYGLAPGTYSVTVFVTNSGGIAISSQTTATVTIS